MFGSIVILFLSLLCFLDELVSTASDLFQSLCFFEEIIFVSSGLLTFVLKVKMLTQISSVKEFGRSKSCGSLFCDTGDK